VSGLCAVRQKKLILRANPRQELQGARKYSFTFFCYHICKTTSTPNSVCQFLSTLPTVLVVLPQYVTNYRLDARVLISANIIRDIFTAPKISIHCLATNRYQQWSPQMSRKLKGALAWRAYSVSTKSLRGFEKLWSSNKLN
jgi:hypothetical protein